MIVSDGYTVSYEPKNNRIIVTLPQTYQTITNMIAMVSNRKIYITPEDEMIILNVVKAIMERCD